MVRSLLIVDDHPDFRRAARDLLSSDDFVVVGEAAGAIEAVRLATELEPELVLLDIKLPDGDGFAVAESLARLVAQAYYESRERLGFPMLKQPQPA